MDHKVKTKPNKKQCIILWYIALGVCLAGTLVPSVYVLYYAFKSMSGTLHGFNGEVLYGLHAFTDTILKCIAFGLPIFGVWVLCLAGTIISIVVIVRARKRTD